MNKFLRNLALLSFAYCLATVASVGEEPPVSVIAKRTVHLSTAHGSATMPFDLSLDWSKRQPAIRRAVITFPGIDRRADRYYKTIDDAAALVPATARETILIVPQFLEEQDIAPNHLSDDFLRWHGQSWEGGIPATGPSPVSSFEVIDALLKMLGDHSIFPNLNTVVLVGHGGGGQLIHRYAIVGRADELLAGSRIHIRYVISNPSSYLYFSDDRPTSEGTLTSFDGASCPEFHHWKYGLSGAPAYVKADDATTWQQLEAKYAQRDVIYLIGATDTDPHEKSLDTSCAAEAQGPSRLARGKAYVSYLRARHPLSWNQHLWLVPDVANSVYQALTSSCGLRAMFDLGDCPDQ